MLLTALWGTPIDQRPQPSPIAVDQLAQSPDVDTASPSDGDTDVGATRPRGSFARRDDADAITPTEQLERPAVTTRAPLPVPPEVDGIVAAPDGRRTGAGTLTSPVDLRTALASKDLIDPGETLWLRGGVYRGAFVSRISGTPEDPIVVSSFPGEWAVIDGGRERESTLAVEGHDVWFRDFEVMKSDPDRTSRYGSNSPPDVSRAKWSGVWVVGVGTKLINLVIHDNGEGVGFWRWSQTSEVYGCVIFNNGWKGSDHGWGHGIYVQNEYGTKTIRDNVIFNNFGYGVHAYDDLGPVVGITVDGVTSFGNGAPTGTHQPNIFAGSVHGKQDRFTLKDSVLYHRPNLGAQNVSLGYPFNSRTSDVHGRVDVLDSRIIGGSHPLVVRGWDPVTLQRNVVVARTYGFGTKAYVAQLVPKDSASVDAFKSYRWDANVYRDQNAVSDGEQPTSFRILGLRNNTEVSFNEWKTRTGLDGTTEYKLSPPSGQDVSVRPNKYERGRGFVTVLNWGTSKVASVDLSKLGLRTGQRFEIRDVQDLFGPPVYVGEYRGARVPIKLDNTSITQPIGDVVSRVKHTPSEFGSFLVAPLEK